MKCDHCHTNEATVHMTNIVNNQKTEQHLCSSCANKLQKDGKLSPFSSFVNDIWDNDFSSNDFFKNMVYPDHMLQSQQMKRCPNCGNTFEDFNRFGKFGCPSCYEIFKNQIASLVQRIQGSIEYEGRVPNQGHNVFKAQYEIKQLRRQLETVIGDENFEEAAQIRDTIKALEAKVDSKEN
ncbi:UvrB/UvrC motif-containing protein [Veillonella sp.]|uniref:UvrB/UvrC motif-containing protein n=1 Tax=Veillonella sp. TaxID=1926307 RepID=UPI0025F76547|nr:UvrB/UvrC motif-containing protein [Veillonella sp.]